MTELLDDGSLVITGEPMQTLMLDCALADDVIAEQFEATFTEASILPNSIVLELMRKMSNSMGVRMPLALMAVNEFWSVYALGPKWLAVHTDIGEVLLFSDLEPGDFERMRIPLPE